MNGNETLHDRFDGTIGLGWDVAEVGRGVITRHTNTVHLTVPPTPNTLYSNAQITDYGFKHPAAEALQQHPPDQRKGIRQQFNFCWQPPLTMTVRAWALVDGQPAGADALVGTAGFGFWNHPFSPDVKRFPRLPQAIWFFFGSPPNDMQLAHGVDGFGWKAATIDASNPRALMIAPLAPFAVVAMQSRRLYDRIYPSIQRALHIGEKRLDDSLLMTPRTYTLEWRKDGARWQVDGQTVFETPYAPRGHCGFCAWIDNQYAIVTPRGRFGSGIIAVTRTQTLVLDVITITPEGA